MKELKSQFLIKRKKLVFKYFFKILIIIFSVQNFMYAQNYFVGFSKQTINPDFSILSSPLAGFGDPRDGRFSIDLLEIGEATNVVAMCSSSTNLYVATADNKLWTKEISSMYSDWNLIGNANNVTSMTYGNGKLYCTDKNNILWLRNSVGNNIPWTNIGTAYYVTSMTFLNNKLYATDSNNILWTRNAVSYNVSWTNIGHANFIRSMTNDGTNLIGVSKYANDLWTRPASEFNQDWLKVGTPNGITYDIYLSNITYENNKLYATSNNNKLYYSQHNQNPIYASAVYFEKNSKNALIITLDLCGIDYSFSKEIKKQIKQQFNINENAILINCSHTHFAPISQNSFSCMQEFYQKPNPKYLLIIKNAIVTATQNAILNKVESNLSFLKGKTDIGYNRADSSKEIDDNITMVISRNFSNNVFNNIILSASSHPVWHDDERDFFTISSNYVGKTREKFGILKNTENIILMQGCAGDINPYTTDTPNDTSDKLANDFNDLSNQIGITGEIITKFDSIKIPINNFTYYEALNIKNLNINKYDQTSERNVRWANKIIGQYEASTVPNSITVYIQIFKIGDWNIIALSREAVSQYAIDLYNYFSDLKLTVLGYSNDVSSYLPVEWHITKSVPNYEGYESFFLYGQSGIPVNHVKDIILSKIYNIMK